MRVCLIGKRGSGKLELLKSLSLYPPIEVYKKDKVSGEFFKTLNGRYSGEVDLQLYSIELPIEENSDFPISQIESLDNGLDVFAFCFDIRHVGFNNITATLNFIERVVKKRTNIIPIATKIDLIDKRILDDWIESSNSQEFKFYFVNSLDKTSVLDAFNAIIMNYEI